MTKGKLILKDIEFIDIKEKLVIRNNTTSGKITLSSDLIGKKVLVIIPKEDTK